MGGARVMAVGSGLGGVWGSAALCKHCENL